ncbi:hypothetical protein LZ554_002803 [Drepanopeziza brunnea f. sp. 'monogermtubi']|nr:hypothetical protein LZ554_002803 [Drepanopeziza brunnea f. sp. 'monogermtubi']
MADAAARATAMNGVQAIFDRYHLIAQATNFNGFDRHLMENLQLVDASPAGTATFEFVVGEQYANVNGVMHGGAAGVIFDMCTTSALGPLASPGFWDFLGGVTRALNISYLRAIPVDTTVRIHSRVLQVGKTMALIRGEMTSLDGEKVYCTAEHHKVSVPSKPEHLLHRIEWDSNRAQDKGVDQTQKAKL